MAVVAIAAAGVATTSTPSSAALHLMAIDVVHSSPEVDGGGGGTAPAPVVSASCTIDAAVLQPEGIRFVMSGTASASGGVALATHVDCVLRTDSGAQGRASGDGVGPVAVAGGVSDTVPFDELGGLRICASASAFFQGGVVKNTTPSSGC